MSRLPTSFQRDLWRTTGQSFRGKIGLRVLRRQSPDSHTFGVRSQGCEGPGGGDTAPGRIRFTFTDNQPSREHHDHQRQGTPRKLSLLGQGGAGAVDRATEGAKFWLKVMNELRTRGLHDILIAVVDGLTGFPDAIGTVFPRTTGFRIPRSWSPRLRSAPLEKTSFTPPPPCASTRSPGSDGPCAAWRSPGSYCPRAAASGRPSP